MVRISTKSLGVFSLLVGLLLTGTPLSAGSVTILDLADLSPGVHPFIRVLGIDNDNGGSFGLGVLGVPVAAGFDVDGDGARDYAIAHMRASPLGRFQAGLVSLIFGNGDIGEELDLEAPDPRILKIYGAGALGAREFTGSEIWMGEVTDDDFGDLLICRQNFSMPGRTGAGALTIVVGSPELRDMAEAGEALDLANPPGNITLLTLVGPESFARLGIWARTGDVDGDGITDFVVAADQENGTDEHEGALYVVRGGRHLASTETIDLADFGSTSLEGNLARIIPPDDSGGFHFGGTCQLGDLDGNGRAEVMAAAALNRAGASVGPFGGSHGSGGPQYGRAYIVWDDAFPMVPWPDGFLIDLQTPTAGTLTTISGGAQDNLSFGEEILGGLDYSGDGCAELFIGDLVGDGTGGNRPFSGVGYVIFQAELIKGLTFTIDSPPLGVEITTILGPSVGAIGSDTAGEGDFNGDGIDDLMIGSPTDDPEGRNRAGTMHVFLGQTAPWPVVIDTAPGMIDPGINVLEIHGALGDTPMDVGDTLCYSAAVGDLNDDGRIDIIANEMRGNGAGPNALDSGNLVVVSGELVPPPLNPDLDFIRGDADGDGTFNGVQDAVFLLGFAFVPGNPPPPCLESADTDDDATFNGIVDALFLLNCAFVSGSPCMSAPFPACDMDPDPASSLGCFAHPGCL